MVTVTGAGRRGIGVPSLGTATNETGTLEFTDPAAGQQPHRFYRAVSR